MNTYKVWALTIDQLSPDDACWLKALGVDVKFETLTHRVYLSGQTVGEYITGNTIDVISTCDQQEIMLKLKYGGDLVLKAEIKSISVPYENEHLVSRG